jgi:uncharacterized protein
VFGSSFGLYILFFIVPLVLGMAVQGWLRSTFARYSGVAISSGLSGADVAREILDSNGLRDVQVQASRGGTLSDNYDPRKHGVFLSPEVFSGRSVAATAVAAHEVGHAIQHQHGYVPMRARSLIWPVASFGSRFWMFILLGGVLLRSFGLIQIAIVVFAGVVVFQIVTLPVEFNASRRAAAQLRTLRLVNDSEAKGVRTTLTAAAMTYVAGALASVAQLLYFLTVFSGGRRS